jgi:hypothetical protein
MRTYDALQQLKLRNPEDSNLACLIDILVEHVDDEGIAPGFWDWAVEQLER